MDVRGKRDFSWFEWNLRQCRKGTENQDVECTKIDGSVFISIHRVRILTGREEILTRSLKIPAPTPMKVRECARICGIYLEPNRSRQTNKSIRQNWLRAIARPFPLGAANRRLALNSSLWAQLSGRCREVTGKLHSGKALAGPQGAFLVRLSGSGFGIRGRIHH